MNSKIFSSIVKDIILGSKMKNLAFGNGKAIEYFLKKNSRYLKKNLIFSCSKNLKKYSCFLNKIDIYFGIINNFNNNFYLKSFDKNFLKEKILCERSKYRFFFLEKKQSNLFLSEINPFCYAFLTLSRKIGIRSKFLKKNNLLKKSFNNFNISANEFKNERSLLLFNYIVGNYSGILNISLIKKKVNDFIYILNDKKIICKINKNL
ncbi:hypothetical protein [Candidatus Vidania fulgoroideorum]